MVRTLICEFLGGHNSGLNMECERRRRIKGDIRVFDLVEWSLTEMVKTVGEKAFNLGTSSLTTRYLSGDRLRT